METTGLADNNAYIEQAIQHYQAALGSFSQERNPIQWAQIQHDLGTLYSLRGQGDESAKFYRNALEAYIDMNLPAESCQAAQALGDVYFKEENWTQALAAYDTDIEKTLDLYTEFTTQKSRESETGGIARLHKQSAYCLLRLGRSKEALIRLEEGKTRFLVESMTKNLVLLDNFSQQDQRAYKDALAILLSVRRSLTSQEDFAVTQESEVTQPMEALRQAEVNLQTVIERLQAQDSTFLTQSKLSWDVVQQATSTRSALVVPFITPQKSMAFIVCSNKDGKKSKSPVIVTLPDFSYDNMQELIRGPRDLPRMEGWLGAYINADRDLETWQKTQQAILETMGANFWPPILEALPASINQLTLLPHGLLHLIPLAAAPLPEGGYVLDRYVINIAPSLSVLSSCQRQAASISKALSSSPSILAVINPENDPDLLFTSLEEQSIMELFSTDACTLLIGDQGNREKVLGAISGHTLLHFSCHGVYNWLDPLESSLLLANDERLTLADLQQGHVDMRMVCLVTLSACETGVTEATNPNRADEYVGLSAGFLMSGIPHVVSSLWPVSDLSTALLIEQFYRYHLRDDLAPATALRQAQLWLRDEVSLGQVVTYIEQQQQKCETDGNWTLFGKLEESKRGLLYKHGDNNNAQPFAHPYYWAAFTLTGI